MKKWIINSLPDSGSTPAWAEQLGISPVLTELLLARGLDNPAAIEAYLSPNLRLLAPLSLWPGTEQAADAICAALGEGRKPLVWGDYDVDGITATALVLDVLEFHGIDVAYHLPDRMDEGYGLNEKGLALHAANGAGILITVDCGISDVQAIIKANELDLLTIISDHHIPPATLPPAAHICNPRLGDCPCPHLAGVGMAFLLMSAVNKRLEKISGKRLDMREVLDLVALGTLADVVPITGQNRILVKNGLLKIAQASRPGISELKAASGYMPTAVLGAGQVVFNLAPRINAAGRLGSPDIALRLLRAKSHAEAEPLAKQLNQMNTHRRSEEESILAEAYAQASEQTHRAGLVLYGPMWHQGVIGIVASRLVDAFYRPVIILCDDNGVAKGSARSIKEFNLYDAISACTDLLIGFGGHHQAAGLRAAKENIEALRERFDSVAHSVIGDIPIQPSLHIDRELDFSLAADCAFLKELEFMQPFGIGNPEPIFCSPILTLRRSRQFGHKHEHLTMEVTDPSSGITLQAKAWNQGKSALDLQPGVKLRLAYTPGINAYNGVAAVELKIKDWEIVE